MINLVSLFNTIRSLWRDVSHTGLGLALVQLIILVMVGTLGYSWFEGWSPLEALYATIITVTTVGYGDFSPQTSGGRIFAVFFTLIAIGLAGYGISTMAAIVFERQATRAHRTILERRMKNIADLKNHMIVCGADVLAHRVTNEFYQRSIPFILIEPDEETLKWALLWMHEGYVNKRRRNWEHLDDVDFSGEEQKGVAELADEMGVLYLLEDPTNEEHLRRAGLTQAKGLVAALTDDRDNMAIVLSARDMANRLDNPNLRIVARVFNEWNMRRMYLAGADKVVSPNLVSGFQIAIDMLNPIVGEFWDHMRFQNSDQLIRFADIPATTRPEWIGKMAQDLNQQRAQLLVAIQRDKQYIFAPDPDEIIQTDDILIVMGTAAK